MTSRLPKKYFDTRELRSSARPKRQEYATQDSRARLAGRARRGRVRGPKFEVFGTSNPELRTSDRAFLACLALHAPQPVALADFFSILLETLLLPPPTVNRFRQAFVRPILLTTTQTSEKKLYIPSHAVNTHAISPVAHPYPHLPGRTLRPPWPCPQSVSRRPGMCGNERGSSGVSGQVQAVSRLPCTHVSHCARPDDDTEPPDGQLAGVDEARARSRRKGPPQQTSPTPGRGGNHRNS